MEYAKLVVTALDGGRTLTTSVVMPKFIAELEYLKLSISESSTIMNNFSKTNLVVCPNEEFDAEIFLLWLKFSMNEITEEEYYDGVYKIKAAKNDRTN